jgi:hypothetical protein
MLAVAAQPSMHYTLYDANGAEVGGGNSTDSNIVVPLGGRIVWRENPPTPPSTNTSASASNVTVYSPWVGPAVIGGGAIALITLLRFLSRRH